MKRYVFLCTFCCILLLPCALVDTALAESSKPEWVSSFFSGQQCQSDDYEGIAYMAIAGAFPTTQELATVESHAKQVLASRYKAIVQSKTVESLQYIDGKTSQEALYDGIAESSLKITIAVPVFWMDEDTHMLWAKVSIPRDKADVWIEDAPMLSLQRKMTQVHGIIYRLVRNEVWIKLEDGRALRFKTNESVVAGDRVVVAYDGMNAKQVYCDNVQLEGRIFHPAMK